MRQCICFLICCLGIFLRITGITAWSNPLLPSFKRPKELDPLLEAHKLAGETSPFGKKSWNLPNQASKLIAPSLVAATLVLGIAGNAFASDEKLLVDLTKEDSVMIEARSPPEIQSSSSDQAIALSRKLKSMNARMYGAYW